MNAYLNYLIEANIGLIVFVGFFWLLLRNETNFRFTRAYIIGSVVFSLLLPFIKIGGSDTIPSIGNVLSAYILPELVFGEPAPVEMVVKSGISAWQVWMWIYLAGVFFFTVRLMGQLIGL